MKILHLPFGYFPDVCGGTEVYVSALSRELSELGHQACIAAPGKKLEQYIVEGIQVFRYPVNSELADSNRNGEGDPAAAGYVGEVLDQVKPDIVHLHALTSGVSLLVLREATKRNVKTVLTYHTPTVTCVQGTLLYKGQDVCDGVMDKARCTACSLYSLGLTASISGGLAHMPERLGDMAARSGFSGKALTALRRKEMVGLRHDTVRKVFAEVDHVIALCDWTEKLLQRNQMGVGKTSVIRHGLPHKVKKIPAQQIDVPEVFNKKRPLRLLYLGRISPEKGVDVIVKAMGELPVDVPVTLDIFGLQQDEGEFVKGVIRQTEKNTRVTLHPPVSPGEVIPLMRCFHVQLVPSQLLETGPFVVLEALSSRTPVVGSRLGGIGEHITVGGDGILVDDFRCIKSWRDIFLLIVNASGKITEMRSLIKMPANFRFIAENHIEIYEKLGSEKIQQTINLKVE